MISLNNISVVFNVGTALENTALRQINLTIQRDDFITLIGGNGAGKSTLVNLLAGECLPCAGQILFEGQDLTRVPPAQRAAHVARVFQDPRHGVCAEFSIEENLALAAKRGQRRTLNLAVTHAMRRLFKERLADLEMGLEDRLGDSVGLLSGGQRQALSLVMATLQPSQLLLLDEHTAALDPKMEQVILKLTHKMVEKHRLTTVMVTHNMQQALGMGNRTLVMREGMIVGDLIGSERSNINLMQFF